MKVNNCTSIPQYVFFLEKLISLSPLKHIKILKSYTLTFVKKPSSSR